MRRAEAGSAVGRWGAQRTWQNLDRLRWAALLSLSAGLIASVLVVNKNTELVMASAALASSESPLPSQQLFGPGAVEATKASPLPGNGQISPSSTSFDWE